MAVPSQRGSSKCPLCCEALDLTERSFFPCPCGCAMRRTGAGGRRVGRELTLRACSRYQVCLFCFQKLQTEYSAQCPKCRSHYDQKNVKMEPPAEPECAGGGGGCGRQGALTLELRPRRAQGG